MPLLDLTPDELLSTTRSVRKRLDFSRPVETELIQQCLELAVQAPTGGNRQMWHFVVVTDEQQRKALGEVYRKGYTFYRQQVDAESANKTSSRLTRERLETLKKVQSSSDYLADHIHEAPFLLIPCVWGRDDGLSLVDQAGILGSLLPADCDLFLSCRARCLRTSF